MQFLNNILKGKNEWYRFIIGFILIFIFWQIIGMIPLMGYLVYLGLKSGANMGTSLNYYLTAPVTEFEKIGGNGNIRYALILLSFAIGVLGIALSAKALHKRGVSTFISVKRIRKNRIMTGFLLWFLFTALIDVINFCFNSRDYEVVLKFNTFFITLLISILFIPLQVLFEELLFRGYTLQFLYKILKSPIASALISGIIFGLVHGFNPESAKYGLLLMLPYYIGFGLFLSFMTILDDGIEIPLGIHIANNIYTATIVTIPASALQTSTIFQVKNINALMLDMLSLFFMLLAFFMLKRYYKWQWGSLKKTNTQ